MKNVICLLILSVLYLAVGAVPSYNGWWEKAGKFYSNKQYDSAAYYYERVAALKPQDAAVYYNLGNTYYRLNLVGPAVLNYERALHIDPSYTEAQDNLSLAQSRIINRVQGVPDIFFINWWHSITKGSNARLWAIISLILFVALLGILFARRMGRLSTPPQFVGILAGLWLVCMILAFTSAQHRRQSNLAVVMQNNAPLQVEPGMSKNQSLVPEGTTVKWQSVKGGWAEVKLPDGRTGWMRENLLARI